MTQLRSVTCRMGSHSVTCYPTQVNTLRLNPSHAGRYSIYLPRRDGRLSCPSWLDSAPAGSRTSDLSITSPTLNHCTTKTAPLLSGLNISHLWFALDTWRNINLFSLTDWLWDFSGPDVSQPTASKAPRGHKTNHKTKTETKKMARTMICGWRQATMCALWLHVESVGPAKHGRADCNELSSWTAQLDAFSLACRQCAEVIYTDNT